MKTKNALTRTFRFNSGIFAGTYHTDPRTSELLGKLVHEEDAGAVMVVMAMGMRAGVIAADKSH